ncbi:AAA family ATPase [Haloferula chungangensis]|uniref:AAA family ATPase n=1 Tax=Haloferula chungangensis TaxID=1048331 RepID=A0ABW2L1D7_9BACT
MHLSSITLTNVRQFDQRTFEFQPGFNLLVGENGAGKTTILRGLLAALGAPGQMGRRPWLEDDDIRLHASHAEVNAVVESPSYRIRQFSIHKQLWERTERSPRGSQRPLVLSYASNEATCPGMKVRQAKRIRSPKGEEYRSDEEFLYRMEMEESIRPRPRSTESRFGNSESVRSFVGKMLSTFDPDFHQFYWRFEPYDCSLVVPKDEKWDPIVDAELEEMARSAALRFFHEDWLRHRKRPYDWPDQSNVVLNPGERERKSSEGYLPDPREIWDRMRMSEDAKKRLQSASLEVKLTPHIMIRRKVGPLRLSQLSDGEQRLFSLFVDIARQLSLQFPTEHIGKGDAIVLIDEIDVHLHPKWQREIVPALEHLFQNCQFIATTHSPFIVQATPPGSVQNIEGRPIGDVADRGIEEIAKKAMDVEGQTSVRYEEELEAAKDYLRAVYAAGTSNESEINALRERLDRLGNRYARNPAYQAFLALKTDARFGSED